MKELIKTAIFIIMLTAVLWFGGFMAFNNRIYMFKNNNEKTDAIVVLTGGKNRIDEAQKLFNDGLADKLFISGVSKEASLEEIISPDEVSDNIEIGQEAHNTFENAIEVNNWIVKNEISSIRLVTSNYHMPRSIEELKTKNNDVKIIIHPVFSDNVQKKWWKSWGSFNFIASEYNKFLFSYIKNCFNKILGND
ncbi:MAG: YdcF family protein [Lactobacillaceae bacterium]|jgi:uncharacterized SAM-binding protein YcdF (DUF218 family)|nr:YdcF family protein [Lactobacillaceae bacterium]